MFLITDQVPNNHPGYQNSGISGAMAFWRCLKYQVQHFSLCPQHAQMAESEVETLVRPLSMALTRFLC